MDVKDTLNRAITELKAGNKTAGRRLLEDILAADRRNESAWLWMSAVVATDAERIICLENVLTLNPYNERARKGLEKLGRMPPPLPITPLMSPAVSAEIPPLPHTFDVPLLDTPVVPVAPPRPRVADYRLYIMVVIVLSLILMCMVIGIVVAVVFFAPTM